MTLTQFIERANYEIDQHLPIFANMPDAQPQLRQNAHSWVLAYIQCLLDHSGRFTDEDYRLLISHLQVIFWS